MIEVEIYEEDGWFHWSLFLRYGIMGGGEDSMDKVYGRIYDELSDDDLYPRRKYPLVFRKYEHYNGFLNYVDEHNIGFFPMDKSDIIFDAGPWINNPEWVHQENEGDSANLTQTDTDKHELTRNGADGEGMTLDEAVWYLRRFRDWHSGNDCRTLKDAELSPRETGMAMDVILAHHGLAKPIRVCERCKYYDGMFGYCHKVTEGKGCVMKE